MGEVGGGNECKGRAIADELVPLSQEESLREEKERDGVD